MNEAEAKGGDDATPAAESKAAAGLESFVPRTGLVYSEKAALAPILRNDRAASCPLVAAAAFETTPRRRRRRSSTVVRRCKPKLLPIRPQHVVRREQEEADAAAAADADADADADSR